MEHDRAPGMKHVFVINPASGKGKTREIIEPQILHFFHSRPDDFLIHVTKCHGDATQFVRELSSKGEKLRFYACGGDGTLFEVINGANGFENVEVASIPLGSGNDFIRIFKPREYFLDLDAQVNGSAGKLDLIRCGDKVAMNICSMGMDAEVAARMGKLKKIPLLSGSMAYNLSILYCFINKIRNNLEIVIDNGNPIKGSFLFALAGNARWYGGGYQGAPEANPHDGLLDFVLVRAVSRLRILSLLKAYREGKHIHMKDICTFVRGKKMMVRSAVPAAVNMDGECFVQKEISFEILESGVNFSVPRGCECLCDILHGSPILA